MNHQPPHDPHRWEPEWMKDMREIDRRVAANIDRYVRLMRRHSLFWVLGGMAGYWIGWLTVELLKWKVGLK